MAALDSARLRRRTSALTRLLTRTQRGKKQPPSSSIYYIIMGSTNRLDRSLLQHRTWCQSARCFFVSDDARNTSGAYEVGMRLVPPLNAQGRSPNSCCANASSVAERAFFCSEHRSSTLAAQYRYMPALAWAKQQPDVDWVALVDDDSFVFPASMARILAKYNATAPWLLGDFWSPTADGGAGATTALYACGGGGSIFSRGALAQMDLHACMQALHRRCMQSDWMLGECAQQAAVRFAPEHGCTCFPWTERTEQRVRARLKRGTCAFLQFPNKPGHRGGPPKDLLPLLRNTSRTPAVVHQLERLV